jgi:hypothetical protein
MRGKAHHPKLAKGNGKHTTHIHPHVLHNQGQIIHNAGEAVCATPCAAPDDPDAVHALKNA